MEQRLRECLNIALKYQVTDIHFNLYEDKLMTIEMRIDGKIYQLKRKEADDHFFRYLMFRANLDVSNITEPQTGQFEIQIGKNKLSLRFSVMASYQLTSGVLRILSNHKALELEDLSTEENVLRYFTSIIQETNGLFLFSGPTGSGKTTTLYTLLHACKGKKIYTLEEKDDGYTITKEKDMWVVDGPAVQRIMRRVNLEDNESMHYFQKCLDSLGVNQKLKEAGVQEGDTVRVVDWELEWYD